MNKERDEIFLILGRRTKTVQFYFKETICSLPGRLGISDFYNVWNALGAVKICRLVKKFQQPQASLHWICLEFSGVVWRRKRRLRDVGGAENPRVFVKDQLAVYRSPIGAYFIENHGVFFKVRYKKQFSS